MLSKHKPEITDKIEIRDKYEVTDKDELTDKIQITDKNRKIYIPLWAIRFYKGIRLVKKELQKPIL